MTNPTPPGEAPMQPMFAAVHNGDGERMATDAVSTSHELVRLNCRISELIEKSAADREIARKDEEIAGLRALAESAFLEGIRAGIERCSASEFGRYVLNDEQAWERSEARAALNPEQGHYSLADYDMHTVRTDWRSVGKVTWSVRRNDRRYQPEIEHIYETEKEAIEQTVLKIRARLNGAAS